LALVLLSTTGPCFLERTIPQHLRAHTDASRNSRFHRSRIAYTSGVRKRSPWDAAARARVHDWWADAAVDWHTAMTDALLSAAQLRPDSVVLDLAAGTGEPALTIAGRITSGRVIALDSSRASLVLAGRRAHEHGLETKIECIQADAHRVPLVDHSVDRVTCRCGIMFFADTGIVMSEVLRVLKPGGRGAFLAWGPFEQPFFKATVATVLRLVRGAEMPPPSRMMFRFASPGSLENVLRAAGFRDVTEEPLTVPRIWAGTPEGLWAYQQEVSTLYHPLFESIPSELRAKVDSEISGLLSTFRSGNVLSVPANIIVAAGQRS
jgi:ubiquinone/menaquinone biosynthesis C-methylase UbiE